MLSPAQLINQTSGEYEYFTPMPIVEAARQCMGGIDLDPFSSAAANERIKARLYLTQFEDGFSSPWFGRCWVNHPFNRPNNARIGEKLIRERFRGATICAITYACTSEKWFQPLLRQPQCYLYPRTNYYLPDGTLKRGVTKGSVVTYFGPDLAAFASAFRALGNVVVPYQYSLDWS